MRYNYVYQGWIFNFRLEETFSYYQGYLSRNCGAWVANGKFYDILIFGYSPYKKTCAFSYAQSMKHVKWLL